jgi:hypothetical protein
MPREMGAGRPLEDLSDKELDADSCGTGIVGVTLAASVNHSDQGGHMTIKSLALATMLLCTNAFSASTTNMVDQWGVASEVGWGLSIQQQADTLFINMFVYDQAGQPTWFIGAVTPGVPAASGHLTFTGDWFKVNGTFYGSPWNSATAQINKVGTIVFDADSVTTANQTYADNGVTVTKRVEREVWSNENYSGNYGGGLVYDVTNCGANNGHIEELGLVSIQQTNNTSMTIVEQVSTGGSCTYAGTYSQLGHMGDVIGNFSCTNGNAGTFHMFEMEKNPSVMSGRFAATSTQGCQSTGHFGGILR